ncbi:MAG: helix-turn-helix domain-containing protein, partial [Pseudomonadota bacterium]
MYAEFAERCELTVKTRSDRELWIQCWQPVYDIEPIDPGSDHMIDTAEIIPVEGGVVIQREHRSHIFLRNSAHIAGSTEFVCVAYHHDASSIYEFETGPMHFGPGEIHVIDYGHEARGIHYQGKVTGIAVPRSMVQLPLAKSRPGFTIGRESPIGRIVYPAFQDMVRAIELGPSFDPEQSVTRLIALLRATLGIEKHHDSNVRIMRHAQLQAILGFIEQHLSDFEFTIDRIYADFGVSRSTLYRMFMPYGGVRRYIQDRRTQAAVIDLATRPYRRGTISRTSDRWGFSSESNFSRAVRQSFGVSPGSIASADKSLAVREQHAPFFSAWLEPFLRTPQ